MIDPAHRRLIESICQRANRLSKEELAAWDDAGADLERDGVARRSHVATRHARFTPDFDEPTVERNPIAAAGGTP